MIRIIPWILAAATAVWFDRMARQAGRNRVAWAAGGALFALVFGTIVLGIGQATCIPFSDSDRTRENIEWTVAAVLVVGIVGWICTIPLHGQHRTLWRRARGFPPPTSGQAVAPDPVQKLKAEFGRPTAENAPAKAPAAPKPKMEAPRKT